MMFVINWWTALITFVVVAALYMYVRHTKPGTYLHEREEGGGGRERVRESQSQRERVSE